MPELPEVETIRRQINPLLRGQRILTARVARARAVRAHRPEEFIAGVVGREILDVRRRGKALILPLDNDSSLLVRLGMSGRLQVVASGTPLLAHTHVELELENGQALRFIDPRTFGQLAIVEGHDPLRMRELGHYGPEPLEESFSVAALGEILRRKSAGVQAVLMDQAQIAGIGKIYADEACFLAGVHPQRAANSLSAVEVSRLHAAIREVLTHSIVEHGTSSQDQAYRDAEGNPGKFQQFLHVYQRANQPCRVCGTPIEYRPFQGRRMHFCPRCQQ